MEKFTHIYQRAAQRKGGDGLLNALLDKPKSARQLQQLGDDRYLAEFTKKIFQSGFVWRVVEQKWPDFEELFWQFDIEKLLLMPPDMLERKAQDPRIIRNFNKVKTILANAEMIHQANQQGDGFASLIAQWPEQDIINLWTFLKKHGSRLGGNTGPYALRMIGKDTFIISRDVEQYFRSHQLIDGGVNTKRSLTAIQSCFNQWQDESQLSMQEISKVIAFSCGDNIVSAP